MSQTHLPPGGPAPAPAPFEGRPQLAQADAGAQGLDSGKQEDLMVGPPPDKGVNP